MNDWKLTGPLSDQVRDLEARAYRAEETVKKRDAEVAEWRNRAETQQGAIDVLTRQLHEAAMRAIHPPIIVQEPKGTAFYYENNGIIHTEPVTWAHAYNLMNPSPIEITDGWGLRWRRLMWKRDVAHQGRVLAIYVEEPR